MRFSGTIGAVLVCGALLPPAAAADAGTEKVGGGYVQAAPCVPAGGRPTAPPATFDFECATGSTTWTEDLAGQTLLSDVHGTVDLVEGTSEGTAKETVHVVAPDGRRGTLCMEATFSTVGNTFKSTNRILSGTGDFAGAIGRLRFEGMLFGTGTYSGWLHTGSPDASSSRAGASCTLPPFLSSL